MFSSTLRGPFHHSTIRVPCSTSTRCSIRPSERADFSRCAAHFDRQTTLAPPPNFNISPHHDSIKAVRRTHNISQHLFSTQSPSDPFDTMSYAQGSSEWSVRKIGQPNTLDFRAYIEKNGTPVSPFHDIPLFANEQQTVLNMIVEIPRWTNGKLEVARTLFYIPCYHLSQHYSTQC